ncbi:MAG: DCC1-like thiol-disulfide oxidoreductase family protein [Vicingaceae bacterium]
MYFDGHCILCNGLVDFLIKRDKKHLFQFASLQGEFAQRTLPKEIRKDLQTVVYIRKGKVLRESDAALAVLTDLGMPWSFLKSLAIFPKSLRDWVYRGIAKRRYRWFGKRAVCRLPNQDETGFFLK